MPLGNCLAISLSAGLALAACGVQESKSTTQDVKDVQSLQQRSDGSFEVICKSGVREIVTPQQIAQDQVCDVTPPTERIAQILSMQLRVDQRYDVICKSGAHEVRSADEIRSGQVCQGYAWKNDFPADGVERTITVFTSSGKCGDIRLKVRRKPGEALGVWTGTSLGDVYGSASNDGYFQLYKQDFGFIPAPGNWRTYSLKGQFVGNFKVEQLSQVSRWYTNADSGSEECGPTEGTIEFRWKTS